MTRYMLCSFALVIGVTLAAAVPAKADPLRASGSMAVSLAGLDLTQVHDQTVARDRIASAATRICDDLATSADDRARLACRDAAVDDARLVLARRIDDATTHPRLALSTH